MIERLYRLEIADGNARVVCTGHVVRCGECKHLMPSGICEAFADGRIRPSASDYCSYGERKSDDKEAD